jgi:hypothetical protein
MFSNFSLSPLTVLLFTVMIRVTHALLLPRALREGQTRRKTGTQSLRASNRGGRAAEQNEEGLGEALIKGGRGCTL